MKALLVLASAAIAFADFTLPLTRRATRSARRGYLSTPQRARDFVAGNLSLRQIPPLPVRDFEDVEYLSNIGIGTPQQVFSLVMDTGSANLWTSSTQCSDTGCSQMHKFNTAASSTYRATSTPFSIEYGTGSCSGNLAFDTVYPDTTKVGITNQQWGVASVVADFFSTAPLVDGIFGLGLDALAVDNVVTPLTNMKSQGLIQQRVLGVYLTSDNSTSSALDFGYVDTRKYSGNLTLTPIVRTLGIAYRYYTINFGAMSVGSKQFDGCFLGLICEAVVDTGTSYLVGPQTIIQPIIDYINVAPDCSNYNSLQNFCITIAGTPFCVPPSVYVLRDGNQCQIAMQGVSDVEVQFWIFGDTFLRTVYAAIDIDNMRVGFAKQKKM